MWFRVRLVDGLVWLWAVDRASAEEGAAESFGARVQGVWREERR